MQVGTGARVLGHRSDGVDCGVQLLDESGLLGASYGDALA